MQPHSMCTLALTHYIWNASEYTKPKTCVMKVEYLSKDGRYKTMYYKLEDIEMTPDFRELKTRITRYSGSFSCTMKARRNTIQEGAEITMEHDVIHKHGLKETFNLWKKSIANGRHHNSSSYRKFYGEQKSPDRKQYILHCELLGEERGWFISRYELEIESLYY